MVLVLVKFKFYQFSWSDISRDFSGYSRNLEKLLLNIDFYLVYLKINESDLKSVIKLHNISLNLKKIMKLLN